MPDVRPVIPLPSRPFKSPVTLAIRNSRVPVPANASLRPAATDVAEADPAQRIAADPSVIDAERHPLYSHGVERNLPIVNYGADPHKTWNAGAREAGARGGTMTHNGEPVGRVVNAENVRLGRLSRWQEQR